MKWSDGRFEAATVSPIGDAVADVSIEVAHVSASLAGSDLMLGEIAAGMRRHKHILKSLEYGLSSVVQTTMCLIDDYNHVQPDNFGKMLSRHIDQVESFGARLDYVVFEADLELLKDEFLSVNRDRGIVRYRKENGRFPCSAHIAMWYLARLGRIETPLPVCRRKGPDVAPFYANQLLSILPRYYDTFEERAAIVLGKSTIADSLTQINHAYFEADPPANLEYYAEGG